MTTRPLAPEDLDHVLAHAEPAFLALRDASLFLTGGTGFFGHWLLETLLHANRELALHLDATVLTRDPAAFRARSPHIALDPAITLLAGDIRTFPLPATRFTHILHAATDSGPTQDPTTILPGTQRVLKIAAANPSARLLYISTGAVYGRSTNRLFTPEDFPLPQLPDNTYEAAKQASEALCLAAPVPATIARCFAFVGPHLPLNQHFAVGNFLAAALDNRPIHITGDGTPRRSWLYMADLAIWLWTLLTHAAPGSIYNVGSDEAYTIAEAAHVVASTLNSAIAIEVAGSPNPNAPRNNYVPDIRRAHRDLNLAVTVPLREALRRTAAWHRP
jgi:dTDP-glucose 4,6-dehydratase